MQNITYTLYADLFFLENIIMNYIIISAASLFTNKILSVKSNPLPRLLGSIIGAAYALAVVLLPAAQGKILGSVFGKIALSLIMVFVVYRPKKLALMLKELGIFCFTGFIFAGIAIGIMFLGVPFSITSGGLMITNLPSGVSNIFITAGVGYIAVSILINSLRKVCDDLRESYVSLYIEFDGQGLWMPALIDTGNELRDPLTGTPVIIVECSAIKNIICPEITEPDFFKDNFLGPHGNGTLSPSWAKRFRVIPFSSLGCESGLLPGFKADNIKIKGNYEFPCSEKTAIICLYDKELSENKKYTALLSPELVA